MRKTILAGGVAALALAAVGGIAMAQQSPAPQGRADRAARADVDSDGRISQAEFVSGRVTRLTALDANRDGTVSQDEARAGGEARREQRAEQRFDRLDANSDGSISRTEFDTARDARPDREGRGGRDGHRGRRRGGHDRMGGGHERGPVVIAEAQAKMAEAFTRLDADRDGYLTQAERRAGHEQRREGRRERMEERRASRAAPASE